MTRHELENPQRPWWSIFKLSRAQSDPSQEEAPLRAELFSISQLERHAQTLANWHRVGTNPRGLRGTRLLARLTANEQVLSTAYKAVTKALATGQQITPADEWFVDNYHLIEEQIRLARRHLPRGYSRELPRLLNGPAHHMPRVYDLALQLISHAHGRVDLDALRAFIGTYQSIQPLQLGELWAIPIMLRLALLENLRRIVATVTAGRKDREQASMWADRLLEVAASDPARVVLVLAEMIHEDPPLSDAFIAELTSRLQGQGPALIFPISWIKQRLAERGKTIEHAYHLTTQSQAADQVAMGNSIGSLRFLAATDWRKFVESMSIVESILRDEQSGVYRTMDFATRDRYRHVIESIARRSPFSQQDVARRAIALASGARSPRQRHVGYFLIDEGRTALEHAIAMHRRLTDRLRSYARRSRLQIYLGSIVTLSVILVVLAALLHPLPGAGGPLGLLGLACIWGLVGFASLHIAMSVVQWIVTLVVKPQVLPRLDFSNGIPLEHRTAVAVPTLLTSIRVIDELVEQLELRFLANRDPQLFFGLLTDFSDAPNKDMPEDEELLRHVTDRIEALNKKHGTAQSGGPFFLCHRARLFNPGEGVWMGWERKRGKLDDFNEFVRGARGRFVSTTGAIDKLQDVAYVIVLDSDTQLPRDSARQLVSTIAHPLNRPAWSGTQTCITEGYTILQPRVGITMASARRSRYAQLFAGDPGIDPYTRAVSDVYQDVFAEGSFIGKGIYAVDAMRYACGGRFPENRVLSHDLLEGSYGRASLVSDVILYEDFPSAHSADVNRRARWTRGDWQIATWLLPQVPSGSLGTAANPISALSKLKIADNLRRSLVPTGLFLLLVLGWLTPGAIPLATITVLAALLLPGLLIAVDAVTRRSPEIALGHHLREIGANTGRHLLRELFALAFLPYDTAIGLSAIIRTAVRILLTRKHLLEWRTAADAARSARTSLAGTYATMWVQPVIAAALAFVLITRDPSTALAAAPILLLWILAPGFSWWLSTPVRQRLSRLSPADINFLRMVARRTWRFFEATVTREDNDLPPDNLQEHPPVGIAHRTSPTNIGCALIANLAAYDFGYLTTGGLIARTSRTVATLDRMARYRGHFYNWYDTRTLEPLRPMYVSTVDSGNLSGHLLTLGAGLLEIAAHPLFRKKLYSGIRDTLDVLHETSSGRIDMEHIRSILKLAEDGHSLPEIHLLLVRLAAAARELTRVVDTEHDDECSWWAKAVEAEVCGALDELKFMAPWLDLAQAPEGVDVQVLMASLQSVRSLAEAARIEELALPSIDRAIDAIERGTEGRHDEAHAWLTTLRAAVATGAEHASGRLDELQQLAVRCGELADHDIDLLFDQDRKLLAIGYNVVDHRLDAGFYDLLASEARLASYLAIAQGKLPQEHWFSLGRQLTTSGGRPALLSWSGSMFEYLMPVLVMPSYPGTMLDATYRAVVDRQIEYGRIHGVPWGVSESGYHKTDSQLNYQYRAFGVPGLGFKRGLGDDLVIAPYASLIALMVAPEAACANLRRLAREGRLGGHGFYEAVDYTASRLPPGKDSVTIQSYMAHHQGMGFLALAYLLEHQPMQRRFLSDLSMRATDLLLQERIPLTPAIYPHPAEVSAARIAQEAETDLRVLNTPNTPAPEVCLLSNGRYHVAVTNAGSGYSRWRDIAVTRWQEDPTSEGFGTFCYLRDVSNGSFWSVAHQPTLRRALNYEAIFSSGRAEYRRRDADLDTHVELSVSPEDDIELRRISITNLGTTSRTIELTTYAEVVLTTQAADSAHPAFSNLFVQTELIRQHQAILCTRRPRSATERPPWMIHMMTVQGAVVAPTSYETSRARFIGRCRTPVDPAAMHRANLHDSEGSVLDPIVSIRNTFRIPADATVRIHVVTGMAETREGAMALIEKYIDRHLADRVFELSWTQSQVMQRQLETTGAQTQLYDRLAGNILFMTTALRAQRSVISRNRSGQSGLWAYGISGDHPIVLLRITNAENVDLVRQLVRAHAYWRLRGLKVDLVVWNEDPSVYRQSLQDTIMSVIATRGDSNLVDQPGGIFVRRSDQMSDEDSVLMQTVARVVLSDSAGTLAEQVGRRQRTDQRVPAFVPRDPTRTPTTPVPPRAASSTKIDRPDLVAFNGMGGFTKDGREYVITTTKDLRTPAPWSNVIANAYFGTVISESGGAYTWCENAHGYRLTPWWNDPVCDASGEALYLRDEDNGRYWSPTPLPAGGNHPYTTRHGFGYSIFEYTEGGISTELRTFVATDAPVKFLVVKMRNRSGRRRRLSLTGVFELVMGNSRAHTMPHVITEVDLKTGALFARNAYSGDFSQRVTFLECSDQTRTITGDRKEVLGRNGDRAHPQCMKHARLSGRVGPGLDPCVAMQVLVDLSDGQDRDVVFMFGSGRNLDDARHLVHRFRGTGPAQSALEGVWAYWNKTLGAVHVQTPDPSLDFLANGWLVYQTLACRMWARSGYYQSGGAFGFRDQLQDSAALVHTEPLLLREHILRAAAQQFIEGDVAHWWHPPVGRGVRTRISDDYLWLPAVVCRYVDATGDTGILNELVGYLEGRKVHPDEDSYYDLPTRSDQVGTLYEHCVRAIQNGLRFGTHGLPLMGTGDWNDGMNLVGAEGKGESVWLGFFLYDVLGPFADLARRHGDGGFADICSTEAEQLQRNLKKHGWDGDWYRRAYFDNGEPLGSHSSPECTIDSLPQSWSILSKAGGESRVSTALASLDKHLVDRKNALIRLFDPPFDRSDLEPGYVKGYVPGVRENGGQYTHAAVWAVMAFAAARDTSRAWELFRLINPIQHGKDPESIAVYMVEPYVAAADVYTNPQHMGRGGWTWYTGSAGWMYRLIVESLLGVRLCVDHLRIEPLVPPSWPSFDVHYRWRDTMHHIHVVNLGGTSTVLRVVADGAERPDHTIPLHSDRQEHWSEVTVGSGDHETKAP